MQYISRDQQRQLTRWIAAVIVAVIGAIFGQQHLPGSGPRPSSGPSNGPASGEIQGVARAIDGDSLFVGRDEVRMKGIDAPEGKQSCQLDGREWACGNAARDELRRQIGNATVQCRVHERDKHGRALSTCFVNGRDINAGMVASGMAVAYGSYLREQGEARAKKRGLWGSQFQMPREWRHERGIGL